MCAEPILGDITWKATKSSANYKTHDNYWDPTVGCGNTTDHVVSNYRYKRASASGFVDGEAFTGNIPELNSLEVGRTTVTHCVAPQ